MQTGATFFLQKIKQYKKMCYSLRKNRVSLKVNILIKKKEFPLVRRKKTNIFITTNNLVAKSRRVRISNKQIYTSNARKKICLNSLNVIYIIKWRQKNVQIFYIFQIVLGAFFSKNNNNKYAIELRCLYTQVLAKLQQ